MAEVTAPSIWYPAGYPGPAYNLANVAMWTTDVTNNKANVRFVGLETGAMLTFDLDIFEAAMQAYVDSIPLAGP